VPANYQKCLSLNRYIRHIFSPNTVNITHVNGKYLYVSRCVFDCDVSYLWMTFPVHETGTGPFFLLKLQTPLCVT
jgi:hypothetical protein